MPYVADSNNAVDAVSREATAAGVTVPFRPTGFTDRVCGGHPWEVAYKPGWTLPGRIGDARAVTAAAECCGGVMDGGTFTDEVARHLAARCGD